MSERKKIFITRVCSYKRILESEEGLDNYKKYNIELINVQHILELFPLVSDPKFHADIIAIDVEHFYSVPGTNPFELIQTLDTIIKCSFSKSDSLLHVGVTNLKNIRRDTKIVAIVDEHQNPNLIKEISSCPAIAGMVLKNQIPNSEGWERQLKAIDDIIDGKSHIPKVIQDLIRKSNRRAKNKNSIELTPRQRQVYKLVAERGASNKVIGRMLNLSESTVKLHISAIFKKYGVKNRTQLAVFSKTDETKTEVDTVE